MNKFEKLYDKVIEIIEWARYQGHITKEGEDILIININEAKEDINNLE